jgi:hypothetical protein
MRSTKRACESPRPGALPHDARFPPAAPDRDFAMPSLAPPAVLTLRYWSAKRLAILIGFVLTIFGSLGSHFYVDPVQDRSAWLDEQSKDVAAKIDTLKNAQAQYLLFQQHTSLVFALNAVGFGTGEGDERAQVTNLYQLSLLDRSNAVRAIIGELALARIIDYAQTRAKYAALIEAARKDFSLAVYTGVDDFERATMDQANSLMNALQQNYLNLGQAKAEADRIVDQRKVVLLALITLGSTFLLAANLISTRKEQPDAGAAPASSATSDDRVAELTTAAQIIEMALDQAKSLGGKPP